MIKLSLKNFWRIFKFWIIAMFCGRMEDYNDVMYCMKGTVGVLCDIDHCPKMQKRKTRNGKQENKEKES